MVFMLFFMSPFRYTVMMSLLGRKFCCLVNFTWNNLVTMVTSQAMFTNISYLSWQIEKKISDKDACVVFQKDNDSYLNFIYFYENNKFFMKRWSKFHVTDANKGRN